MGPCHMICGVFLPWILKEWDDSIHGFRNLIPPILSLANLKATIPLFWHQCPVVKQWLLVPGEAADGDEWR